MNFKTFIKWTSVAVLTVAYHWDTAFAQSPDLKIEHLSDTHTFVRVNTDKKYVLLPIQESAPESGVNIITDSKSDQILQIRLAMSKIDYYVPFDVSSYKGRPLLLDVVQTAGRESIRNAKDDACWKELKTSNTFDTSNKEPYRLTYHFSPAYGWMNDPNGMVYKDGTYHLFYQHNPYGSLWGNLSWGHATSTDLLHWKHEPVALFPDALGAIFSGSAVVDKDNTAGFGHNAIVAMYTSAGKDQTQSLAYSTDDGRTFKKYEQNPVITGQVPDFRDPKIFWNDDTKKWNVILAAGQEVQFYSSSNLKNWTYESSFGHGYGNHDGVWECPDMVKLPVKGTGKSKWVLLLNINPGGPFGGSATQYFTGDYDGHRFTCDSRPETTKWMDYGKDHYATVTWSNAPEGRAIALAWMSNWQYANDVPTRQFRSSNSVSRDLSLYEFGGEVYLSSNPSREMTFLRGKHLVFPKLSVGKTKDVKNFLKNNTGAYEILVTLQPTNARTFGFALYNAKGEKTVFTYNIKEKTFAMDRTKSGLTDFSKDFAAVTKAPLKENASYTLRLLVDKSSIEAFDGAGMFCMTNLVFPTEVYNNLSFFSEGGKCKVTNLTIYPLNVK